jgi:hypothetical protein
MMGIIKIDANIFPLVMSVSIGDPESPEFQSIGLPQGANLLYLQGIKDKKEIELLRKFAYNETFSDCDYESLFKLFITNIPRLKPPTVNSDNFLQQFGVRVK